MIEIEREALSPAKSDSVITIRKSISRDECEDEEVGNALSACRALPIIYDGSPVEMAKCFYTEILLPVSRLGLRKVIKSDSKALSRSTVS
jgi:hypothetical protein